MNTVKCCSKCGKPVPAEAPLGLCPECLMKAGLETESRSAPNTTALQPKWPAPGQQFGGYRILRELGHGGMGVVYEAEQLESGRRLALKVLSQALTSEADVKRFLREGRLAAAVSHPNVVYVFGSEEIDGNPVIAMELVTGGTLSDRVKQEGPLKPTEAVDTILQIVAGLEAAHAAGVLHRDIKPHNCFVDCHGTVKIGDFGLSIPIQPRPDSLITAPGSILGTPAFASPEQLRGAELDVASDIYSVGATLYYLLTGHAPFEEDDIVKLITAVLDRAPESPRSLCPDIPTGLAALVVRCLAKECKARFMSYGELRAALQPFSSAAPTPATLGLRFAAGVVDAFLSELPSLLLMLYTGYEAIDYLVIQRSRLGALIWAAFATWMVLYFALPEGRWGASLGKAICGLRVVGPAGHAPGMCPALGRAAVFVLMPFVPFLLEMMWMTGEQYHQTVQSGETTFSDFGWIAAMVVLFLTIRRRNGFAGLHELISSTRVVAKPKVQARPAFKVAAEPVQVSVAPRHLGPYVVLRDNAELLLGYDEILRRKVWIRLVLPGTAPVPVLRRDLGRAGRLRWLNGRRSVTENWDAYEAPDGVALLELVKTPQPWAAVRFWLLDLAEEIHAGLKDQTLPPLALESVWITATGRAVLLDVQTTRSSVSRIVRNAADAQKFLHEVATKALGNTPAPSSTTRSFWRKIGGTSEDLESDEPVLPPPLHAAPFLESIRDGKLLATEFIVANLKSLCEKVPAVSRRRRLGSLLFAPGCILVLGAFLSLIVPMEMRRVEKEWSVQHPGLVPLWQMLAAYDYVEDSPSEQRAVGLQIAARYRPLLNDAQTMKLIESAIWWEDDLPGRAAKILAAYPAATEQEWREAEQVASEVLEASRKYQRSLYLTVVAAILPMSLAVMGTLSLFCTLLFGVNPMLRLLGIAVVNKQGEVASRWRLLARTATAWLLPFLLASKLVKLGQKAHLIGLHQGPWVVPVTALVLFAGALVWMVLTPSRGPQDRMAGTWLVPR